MMRFAALSLLLLLSTSLAAAQDPDSDPALPEITPRDIEIRGEYRVVFPSLERPTLQELQPRTRVQALPLEGLPAPSPIDFQVDALPPLNLDPPSADYDNRSPLSPLLDGMNGSLELAGGRFTERRAATHLQLPLSTRTHLGLHGTYEGMQGAQPFDERDARTAFDGADGELSLSHRGGTWGLASSVDGAYKQYDLFGVTDGGFIPERTTAHLGTLHTIRVHEGLPLTWSVGYDAHDLTTEDVSRSTQRFHTDLDATVGLSGIDVSLRGTAELAGHNGNSAFAGDSRSGTLHGIVAIVNRPDLQVEGGATLISGTTDLLSTGERATQTHGAPYGLVEWRPASEWTLYAEQEASLQLHTPIDLIRTNPYLLAQPELGITATTLDATGGIQWAPGPAQLDVHGGVAHSPSHRFFALENPTVYAPQYREATTWTVGLDATLQAHPHWFGTLTLNYTGGSVADEDGLPFVARTSGEATVGYQFSDRQARIQAHLRGQEPRDLDATGQTTAPGFVGLGLSGDVQVAPNIEVIAYIQDIGSNDMTEWPGYPQPTARVGGGLRLLW